MQIRLNDRVAVVTGGSRGIGQAISLSLATTGATVVVNYRGNQAAANETVAAIVAAGGQAVAIQADVADGEDVERLFEEVNDRFGRIDILVNNAGITRDTLMLRMKDDDWDAVMDTNLRGLFLCTRAVLRPMTRARWGRIINITSVVGLMGNAGQATLCCRQSRYHRFHQISGSRNWFTHDYRQCRCPWFYRHRIDGSTSLPETREALIKQIPLGRLGTPDDVAGLVTFLASEQAAYITGQTFRTVTVAW
jgi:3-oxoacyl-[acyl-carrier protein] reductase